MSKRPQPASGFTLIELLVTVSILAVLAAVAAPSLGLFTSRATMRGLGNDFVSSLQRTRLEAINRNMCATMCMSSNAGSTSGTASCDSSSTNWGRGWIVFLNPSCNSATTSPVAGNILSLHDGFTSRYSLTNHSGNSTLTYIMFTPRGIPQISVNSGFNLIDANVAGTDNINRTVCLDLLGRTRTVQYVSGVTC